MRPVARLIVEEGPEIGAEFEVSDLTRIGRLAHLEVPLSGDRGVSREHALIRYVRGRYFVRDLGSRGGTLVNRTRVKQAFLRSGDRIRVGDSVLLFLEGAAAPSPGGSGGEKAERACGVAEQARAEPTALRVGEEVESDAAVPTGTRPPAAGPVALEERPRDGADLKAAIEAGRKGASIRRASIEAALFALLLILVFLAASTLTRVILRLLG